MTREIHKKLSKKYFDLVAGEQKILEFVTDFECEPDGYRITLLLEEEK